MIALLVNPAAGRGRAAQRAPRIAEVLATLGSVRRFDTAGPGDERRQARAACEAGAQMLAVVGGDGALHHAMRGLLDADAHIPLVPFAAGTGNDFVKALGLPAYDAHAMVARIAAGQTRRIDLGMVDDVPFLNAAGFGFDVDVLQRMQHQRWLRGTAAYLSTALQALFGYCGFSVRHEHAPAHDSRATQPTARAQDTLMLVCANGHCFGGAFRIAPDAAVDDGWLDLVHIADLAWHARPRLFLRAMRGTHIGHAAVTHRRATTAALLFREPPRFEADGELYVAATSHVRLSVRPGALTVIA